MLGDWSLQSSVLIKKKENILKSWILLELMFYISAAQEQEQN